MHATQYKTNYYVKTIFMIKIKIISYKLIDTSLKEKTKKKEKKKKNFSFNFICGTTTLSRIKLNEVASNSEKSIY